MADTEKKATKRPVRQIKVDDKGAVKEKPAAPKKPPAKRPPPAAKEPKEKALPPAQMSKEKVAQKVEDSKELSQLIKELGAKNQPATEKEITKLAKDTIKLVGEAQRSGSLAFKRESTKALVQIRTAVDKMAFAKDANKEKLMSDIDSVVLDAKNITLYMTSVAKGQADIIKAKAKAEAKQIKADATNQVKATKAEAAANARRISAQADLEAKALEERTTNELKVQRAEQVIRLKRIRGELADRAKRVKEDAELREEAHKIQVDEEKKKLRAIGSERLQRIRTLKADLNERRIKEADEHKDRTQKLKEKEIDLNSKRSKHNAEHKERLQKLRQQERTQALEFRTKRDEAKVKVSQLYKEIRESNKGKENIKTNNDAKAFLGKVGEGVADANPLLVLGYTLIKGLKDTTKMMLEKTSKTTRSERGDTQRIERIYEEEQREDRKDRKRERNNDQNSERKQRREKRSLPGANSRLRPRTKPVPTRAGTPAPTGPKASTVAPTSGNPSETSSKNPFSGLLSLVSNVGSFLSAIGSVAKVVGPVLATVARAVPAAAIFAFAVNGVLDFISGFNNATKLFTDELNPSFLQKLFAGFTNVFASLLGVFDHVTNLFGVNLDLKGKFEKGAKGFYDTIAGLGDKVLDIAKNLMNAVLAPFQIVAGKMANVLSKLPFMSDKDESIKNLRAFSTGGNTSSNGPKPNISSAKPKAGAQVVQKQAEVNNLKEKAEASKPAGNTTAVVDNSIKNSNTTIVGQKLSTRNSDQSVTRGGYAPMGR